MTDAIAEIPTLENWLGSQHPDAEKLEFSGPIDIAIFSDAHMWGKPSDAFKIFVQVVKAIKPHVLVNNGDSLDGASISRHARIGWESRPTLVQEIEANKQGLLEISHAAKAKTKLWLRGNHDDRFDSRLSNAAPEYEGIGGTRLQDHFPGWLLRYSAVINDTLVIKHRFKGGEHAAWNNVIRSGRSIVTGHDHTCYVRAYTDYSGTRYGATAGTLADIYGPQFHYTEHNPVNWQSGFLHVHVDGRRVHIEPVHVFDGRAWYMGKWWKA